MIKTSLTFLILCLLNFISAQDPAFSQPNQNLTYLNPAFAGTTKSLRAGFSYRNQWPNISGNYITTNVYVDQYLGKWGGIGLTYIRDKASNTLTSDNLYLDYAYHFKIGKKGVLSLGVELGYIQKSIDWENLTFGDVIDPRRGFIYPTPDPVVNNDPSRNFDFGGGILYYNKFLFASYGIHHINEPNISLAGGESKLPILHSFYAGGMIKVSDFTISPQIDVKFQGAFNYIVGLTKVNYKWATIGVGYRNNDAIIWVLGVALDKLSLNYSYDATSSALSKASGGSHEIGLQLLLNTLNNKNERTLRIY